MVDQIRAAVTGSDVSMKVGVEAAGHYPRPLLAPSAWPVGWEVLQLNPAHVAEQRRVQGRGRVKTDAIDLEAITVEVRVRHMAGLPDSLVGTKLMQAAFGPSDPGALVDTEAEAGEQVATMEQESPVEWWGLRVIGGAA